MKNDNETLGPELPPEDNLTRAIMKTMYYAVIFVAVVYVMLIVAFELSYP